MLHALEAILVGLFHGLVRIHVNVHFNVINLNTTEEGRLLPRKGSELYAAKSAHPRVAALNRNPSAQP